MIEEQENYLRCREYLRENVHRFIEAFVEYYGEEYRKEIEEKMNHVLYLAFIRPESIAQYISRISSLISQEMQEKLLKKLKSSLTREEVFGEYAFEFQNLQPINKFTIFYNQYKLGAEGRKEVFKNEYFAHLSRLLPGLTMAEFEKMIETHQIPSKYDRIKPWIRSNLEYAIDLENAEKRFNQAFEDSKELIHGIDPDITKDNFGYYLDQKKIQDLIVLAETREATLEEYKKRMSKYDKYTQESETLSQISRELNLKYRLKLIEENIDLIPESEREDYEKFKRNPTNYYLGEITQYIFGYSISANHPLEAFTTESNRMLNDKKTTSWKKDSIKRDRMEYFRRFGIDLGKDYQAYEDSEEAKKIWPSEERADFFIESRNHLLNEYNIEFYSNTPEHIAGRKEIDSKHFLDKEDSFNARIYVAEKAQTFTNPNLIRTKKGYQIYPLLVVDIDRSAGQIDHDIVHELNHIFELSISEVKDKYYELLCGWDIVTGELGQQAIQEVDTLSPEKPKREYELFNEIINELITKDILAIFEKNGQHVFDDPEKANKGKRTSYEFTFFIVEDFYKEYKKEIIASRHNGNIQIIWDKVGKENFDALNDLFHTYFEHFDGFKIYGLLRSLKEGEQTEQTKVYEEIVRKRDEILKKMRMHSMLVDQQKEDSKKSKEKHSK